MTSPSTNNESDACGQANLPVLQIHAGDDGRLSYKPAGQKGARWRGGFRNMGEVFASAAEFVPGHCVVDFVEIKD
jgi:hypothetical protein